MRVDKLSVATAFLLFGCTNDPVQTGGTNFGVATLVDGRVGVVDLQKATVGLQFRPATRGVVETATIPETREFYTADPNSNEIIRYQFGQDFASVKETERFAAPVYTYGILADERPGAARDKMVVVSREALRWKILAPSVKMPDDSIAIYDRAKGQWTGTVQMKSPSRGLVRGNLAYITEVHDRALSVVDIDTMKVLRTEKVGPETWPARDELSVGPVSLASTRDGRFVLSADFEGLSITTFDTQSWQKTVTPVDGVVYTISFSPDEKQLYVVTYDLNMPMDQVMAEARPANSGWYDGPQPLDEAGNATRKTRVRVYDWPSMKPVTEFRPTWAGQRVFFSKDPNRFYLTTSAGSVLFHDKDTLRLRGEAVVGGVGYPVFCGSFNYF